MMKNKKAKIIESAFNTESKEEKALKKRNYKLQYNKICMEIRKKLNEENVNELNELKNEYFKKVKDINKEYIDELNKQYDNKFKQLKMKHKEQFNEKFNKLYNKQKEVDKKAKKTEIDQVSVYAFIESCFSQDN